MWWCSRFRRVRVRPGSMPRARSAAAVRDAIGESPEQALRTLDDRAVAQAGRERATGAAAAGTSGGGGSRGGRAGGAGSVGADHNLAGAAQAGVCRRRAGQTPLLLQSAAVRVVGQVARAAAPDSSRAVSLLQEILASSASPQILLLTASLYAQLLPSQRDAQPLFRSTPQSLRALGATTDAALGA
jgi:hypothetical protein